MSTSSPFEQFLRAELIGEPTVVLPWSVPAREPRSTYGWWSFARPLPESASEAVSMAAWAAARAEVPACNRHLGLGTVATASEIRRAFRRLALERHPDRSGGSTAAFVALDRAYREALKAAHA